ncbi:MAG: hypothetical protein KGI78_03890 [Patescibacteria group bacterium]|nr:hypothetical protein [Patescibacteria group bacterium]MDE1944129.1 hypothetical protein [Patescibacteria group bacterium]MDE1944750.1 hypothetical protein [Patescibacteria group bacterium]MDE2057964.1 hypothetical protein [Patescibacteria group bacterium]
MNDLRTQFSAVARRVSGFTPRPERDWRVILSLGALLFAAILAWHLYLFTATLGSDRASSAGEVAPVATPSALETLPAFLAARTAEEEKYVTGSYQFADPSQ